MSREAALPDPAHLSWLVRGGRRVRRDLCRLRLRLYVQRLPGIAAARFRRLARLGVAGVLARRLSLFRPRHRQRPPRRPLRLAPPRGGRHDPDRPRACRRQCGAQPVEVYAAYGLGVGLGVGCAYVPAIGAVQRWFVRRRGFASGLAVSGIGVGTLVMPPLATLLIETFGWRGAYLALGALAAVIGGGMALLIENDPRARGLGPDGDPRTPGATSTRPKGASVGEAIRSRTLHRPLRRLPDLLVRRVRAVRASRALCRGPRRCAPPPRYCCWA